MKDVEVLYESNFCGTNCNLTLSLLNAITVSEAESVLAFVMENPVRLSTANIAYLQPYFDTRKGPANWIETVSNRPVSGIRRLV